MSIHKSKGLEYPVVIVAGLGKRFNETDARNPVVLHMDWGLGLDYVDGGRRLRIPTLFRRAIQRKMREEMLGEELRVLYVALTRAKEKLILTGTVKDAEQSIGRWAQMQMSFADRFGASSALDFVMPAVCRQEEGAGGGGISSCGLYGPRSLCGRKCRSRPREACGRAGFGRSSCAEEGRARWSRSSSMCTRGRGRRPCR